ncbi:TRAP transporter small permease [Halomonas alkalisoli]|uniref:TRAP transporter small permease n=1 Tax=Halomonas alkalisoli TaxID=2907158 RepID=UPI001F3DBEB0|nr:TRAP transporter small permease [Halomonas alkalisoli]MCE9684149.1 TRAP transporter small permease [Halomonas alkalisoli]
MKLSNESSHGEVGMPTSLLVSSKNVIYHAAKWIGIFSIVAMFLSLMSGVVVRYIWSTNLGWVTEVPNLLFPWLTMGAIVAAAARNEHIGIELLVEKLPTTLRKLVIVGVNVIAMVAFAVISLRGLDVVEIAGSQRLPITKIAMSWAYWSIVAGFVALSIVSLLNVLIVIIGGDEFSKPPISHGEDGI